MSKSETQFTNKLKHYIEKYTDKTRHRVFFLKIHGGLMQRAGIPDVFIAFDGMRVWLEVKCGKNIPQLNQELTIREMKAAGVPCYVLRNVGTTIALEDEKGTVLFCRRAGDTVHLRDAFTAMINWLMEQQNIIN